MSKYTVSKWHVDPDGYILSETGDYIASVAIVCDDEKRQVNTRLIAAAPEMYKLLRIWVNIQEQPTLKEAQASARELLTRIDGKEAEL